MNLSPLNVVRKACRPAHSRAKRLTQTITGIRDLLPSFRFSGKNNDTIVGKRIRRGRKIKISVESERLLVFVRQQATESWCSDCRSEVRVVRLDEATAIVATNHNAIRRRIELGTLHVIADSEEGLLICLNSLLQQL